MTEDRLDTPAAIAKARERDQRPCVWDEGAVPRHVAEFLWDAVHDRHVLLAALAAVTADRDAAREDAGRLARMLEVLHDEPEGFEHGRCDPCLALAAHRSLR